jgi:hypothetical protein
MYTQVTFGIFFDRVLTGSSFDFKQYPNPALDWHEGDWGYEFQNDMSVRVFRYLSQAETTVDGPKWNDTTETRELFEPRFEAGFKAAIRTLQDVAQGGNR